jgi:eukaryotic-like serine/threonine-protein kinase
MGTDHGYRELAPRGTGPAATVYAGFRADTGDAVALKVFRTKLPRRARTEVERELARLTPLREKVAVLVADGIEDLDDRTALRMELCTESLSDFIGQNGPMPVAEVIALGKTLADALAAAHEAGIVHGGVTPGNVLFRPAGQPVLADFGLTLRRAFPHESGDGVDFLAPETLEYGTADERSDLYGLGAVLYLALTGLSPHPARLGEHPDDRKLRVLGSPVPRPDRADVPDELAELLKALLAKNPVIRPGSMKDVATWLTGMANRSTVDDEFDDFAGAPAVTPPRPHGAPVFVSAPGTTPKRHPSWPVIGGAAGLLAVVAVGVLLLRSDPQVVNDSASSAPQTSTAPPKAVVLELAEPADNGNYVDLSWQSPEQLDFAVLVAGEGQEMKIVYTQQKRTARVEVDATRKYCFLVQGTEGSHVYESKPKAIRNAKCKL